MMTRKTKFVAGLGAVALCSVLAINTAQSATTIQQESGSPFSLPLQTTVDNAIDVTVTGQLLLGTFGTVTSAGDTATATLDPDSTFNEDIAGPAKIVDANGGDHAAAVITVIAFPDTTVFVDYNTVVDLQDTTDTYTLDIVGLTDNLDAPPTGVPGVATTHDGTVLTQQGSATTTNGGDLVFNIGASIETQDGVTYPSGVYDGSFQMTISY